VTIATLPVRSNNDVTVDAPRLWQKTNATNYASGALAVKNPLAW
jgi:hypothetical protein